MKGLTNVELNNCIVVPLLTSCNRPSMDSKPLGHLQQASRTLTASLQDTYTKPLGHLQQASRTLTASLQDTYTKPPEHLQQASRTLTPSLQDTYSKHLGHLQQASRTLTPSLQDTYSKPPRPEERRVGKERGTSCRSRRTPYQ
jgi:exonuclease VII large subunit